MDFLIHYGSRPQKRKGGNGCLQCVANCGQPTDGVGVLCEIVVDETSQIGSHPPFGPPKFDHSESRQSLMDHGCCLLMTTCESRSLLPSWQLRSDSQTHLGMSKKSGPLSTELISTKNNNWCRISRIPSDTYIDSRSFSTGSG